MSGPRTPDRNAEIDREFVAAIELPAGRREGFLARLRTRDPELAAAVADLLAADERVDAAPGPGAGLRGALWDELASEEDACPVGARVGAYRIVGELGRGGMSVVYLAERADELFEHRVALKFLTLGAGGEAGIRRFEQERQILASLSHPNITRLLDGRVDADGRPYIAMELVEGRSITLYCAEENLGLESRLDLFACVADAVAYAHRHLVVHRDLKPSNILVDEDGHVKLLDFGIARLLEPAGSGRFTAPPTRAAARVLTPEYASPEQLRGEHITTWSDVYQLGLLLYELLTCRRPFDLEGATPARVEHVVCDEDPPLPSSVEGPFARRLRGDLDNIVRRAIEKEPERRYDSVGELREELDRYRDGKPVRARPPTLRYRVGRFIRRHTAGLAAAAAVLLLLVSYAATVTVQGRRIAAEAAKTEQVKEFLASLFVQANPGNSKGADVTASELVAAGANRVAVELEGQPAVQAEMMSVLGSVYATLGQYEAAIDQLEPALVIFRRLHGPVHEDVARTERELATALHFQGRYAESEARLRSVLEARRELFGEESRAVGETLNDLADLLHSQGRLVEAEDLLRRGLRIHTSGRGGDENDVARAQRDLANVLRDRGLNAEAEVLYRSALPIWRAQFGDVDPLVALAQNELGRLLVETGRHDEAEALFEENLSVYAVLYPDGHPMEGTTYRNIGLLRLRQKQPLAARAALERALTIYSRTLSENNALVPRVERYLAEALLAAGDPDAAAVVADGAVEQLRALGLTRHPAVVDALRTAGLSRLALDRSDEAVGLLAEALALREASSAPSDAALAALRTDLERARDAR